MAKIKSSNRLEEWEVRIIKAMLPDKDINDQEILAYFTRPKRTINHARIKEIRDGIRHEKVSAASPQELKNFLATWPQIDPVTGLHIFSDELLIKAREAMLHAVNGYNGPKTYFKSEVFIVTAIIAWTYLSHWHYKNLSIDIRCTHEKNGKTEILKTKHGAEKLWDLETCLKHEKCSLDDARKPEKGFGVYLKEKDWWWYETWLDFVRAYCKKEYGSKPN